MIPWTRLDTAQTPDGTELSLWQRGDALVIRAGARELMSNRAHGSEELLAEHGCEGLAPGASVLIGGLGMGFTLRAALAQLGSEARVVVAELCAPVVGWLRGPVGGGAMLDDPRVTVDVRDVGDVAREKVGAFDAILLDVDNGPSALTDGGNAWLYGREGTATLARALRPGGLLAVWSAGEDPTYVAMLTRARLAAQAVAVRARREGGRGRGARHVIFLGRKPAGR
jgi:spermidine synthase